jgi:hypothetical protein
MGLVGIMLENPSGQKSKVFFAPNLHLGYIQRILELRNFLIPPDDDMQYRVMDGLDRNIEYEWFDDSISSVVKEKGSNFDCSYKL